MGANISDSISQTLLATDKKTVGSPQVSLHVGQYVIKSEKQNALFELHEKNHINKYINIDRKHLKNSLQMVWIKLLKLNYIWS